MLSKAISDHWKERALLAYAARIFRNSLGLLLILACACLPLALAVAIGTVAGWPLWQLANSAPGMVVATLAGIVYFRLRRHVVG